MRLAILALLTLPAFCQYLGNAGSTSSIGVGPFLTAPYSNVGVLPLDNNPTATVTDAATAAQALANRTAYWLIQLNPIAASVLRFTVPQGAFTWGHATINFPNYGNTVILQQWASTNPASPNYSTANLCWGVSTPYTAGCWNSGQGNAAPSLTVGPILTANPVILNHNPAMLDRFAQQMAADYLDASVAGLYAQFTAHTPVGVPGTPLTDAVLGQAVATLNTDAAYTPGEILNIVLGEEMLQPYYQSVFTNGSAYTKTPGVNDFRTLFKRGLPTSSGQVSLGGQTTSPFEIIISSQIKITGATPVAHHAIAFYPPAIVIASMTPNPGEDINNTATSGLIPAGFAIVGSQPVNNFISAIRYSTTPVSGNNYSFTVDPAWVLGILNNRNGVRVEY